MHTGNVPGNADTSNKILDTLYISIVYKLSRETRQLQLKITHVFCWDGDLC